MLETNNKPIAIKNSTHFCGFFGTTEQAEAHRVSCQTAREDLYVASLYGPPTRPCSICNREELLKYQKPLVITCPYGTSEEINYDITVIRYLDYGKSA